jgi:hypothetical protein
VTLKAITLVIAVMAFVAVMNSTFVIAEQASSPESASPPTKAEQSTGMPPAASPSLSQPSSATSIPSPTATAPETFTQIAHALSPFAWPVLVLIGALYFHSDIRRLTTLLLARIREGSALKIGPVELSNLSVVKAQLATSETYRLTAADDGGKGAREKDKIYKNCRYVFVAYQLYRSREDGQLFDILLYLIGHERAPLIDVKEVRYYLGTFWNNRVYTSTSIGDSFGIVVSAYGPTLCYAEIVFKDEYVARQYRYLDFEMAYMAPAPAAPVGGQ